MNYSKKNQNNGLRWLIASWVFFLAIGVTVGAVTVNIVKNREPPPEPEEVLWNIETHENGYCEGYCDEIICPFFNGYPERQPLYGTRDGRMFTDGGEMSMDWSAGDLNFKPLATSLSERTQEFIFYLSYGYYIDFPFVMGLIKAESTFRTHIISETNDYGLMQINIRNHDWLNERFGIDDLLDPEQNIRAGLFILRTLFEKYDDPAKVLMAYNMGEHGANLLWEQGVFDTNYTRRVMTYAEEFRRELESDED